MSFPKRYESSEIDLTKCYRTTSSRAPDRIARPQLRVLVVEDNPGDLDLVSQYLSETPAVTFAIRSAQTLVQAADVLAVEHVDAVILGLNLPDSRGVSTLLRIKELARGAAIVVVSSHVDDDVRATALDNGADEVFAKSEYRTRLLSLLYVIERSRARAEHRELERVIAAAPDAILVVSLQGEIRYANQAACVLFDREQGDLIGTILDFPLEERATSELTITRDSGASHCEVRVVRIEWWREGALLATLRDVTEQRKLETQVALSDRMVTIGTLAAGIGHEINNPLAAVIANLDLAVLELARPSDGEGTTELLDALRDAREGAERIRQIVRDLKMFSRSEDETRGPVDVHRVLDSTVRMAWNEMRHRARLVKDYGKVALVEASDARLGQVMLNLLVNAAHAIPEGDSDGNEIRIATGLEASGRVVVSISDTGSGIPVDVQARIFTPFFSTKPVGVGTGLGLAISQRIVTSFGGELTFESEVGKGTRFSVVLPAADVEACVVAPVVPMRAAPCQVRGRILVVDDEPAIVHVVRRILETGHDVTGAASASVGLSLLAADGAYDVVLCDLMMPQMTGMDLYGAVRGLGNGIEDRIVFMTGGAFTSSAREFLESVQNRRIEKPFDLQGIRVLVNELVRESRSANVVT